MWSVSPWARICLISLVGECVVAVRSVAGEKEVAERGRPNYTGRNTYIYISPSEFYCIHTFQGAKRALKMLEYIKREAIVFHISKAETIILLYMPHHTTRLTEQLQHSTGECITCLVSSQRYNIIGARYRVFYSSSCFLNGRESGGAFCPTTTPPLLLLCTVSHRK